MSGTGPSGTGPEAVAAHSRLADYADAYTASVAEDGFYYPGTSRLRKLTPAMKEALETRLYQIVQENQPATVPGIFYIAETLKLVPKTESGYDRVQSRLLDMRRQGSLPWHWITDLARDVYGRETYSSFGDFLSEVTNLYVRDHWRTHEQRVEVWLEKRFLSGVISPIVIDKWGLNLYISVGQSSETYLHRAGTTIHRAGKPTHIYILTDLDPSGVSISENITRKLPGFTGGVPVYTTRLAVNRDQVASWNLPTRPAKETGRRRDRFEREHGEGCVELDAIPPNALRRLVDEAIARHADMGKIRVERLAEAEGRRFLETWRTRLE
jgi:hypothetical protein